MMQGSIPIRFICFLVATQSLFTSALQANAGVRIAMADDLKPGRHFLVIATIFNRGFDSFSTDRLASSFLTRGEKKDILVLAAMPFIYDHVSELLFIPPIMEMAPHQIRSRSHCAL